VQASRKLIIGTVLALSLTACASDGERGVASQPSGGQFIPLSRLKAVNLDKDFSAAEDLFTGTPKVLGEIRKGPRRLVAYIEEGSCGLLVTDASNPERALINITSAWPKAASEGSNRYPVGPYSFTSGAGANKSETWASLYCSKTAMVINYSSQGNSVSSHHKGNVSTKETSPLTMVIGSPEAREKVLRQA
jgi:hypothetical protein